MSELSAGPNAHATWRNSGHVFLVFLRLGLTSFGGPTAHLGFFRDAFVQRRNWLSDRSYADLVALCQFLPGPASSQVGMAIGLHRAGVLGLIAAWTAFTLPSAIALVAFAYGATALLGAGADGWLIGLKAVAVAIVAQAVAGMAKSLAPDATRATIAVAALIVVLLFPSAVTQVAVILGAAVIGLLLVRGDAPPLRDGDALRARFPRWVAVACLGLFFALLILLPILAVATRSGALQLADVFYRTGALVFGGGHVVLPMLQNELVPTGMVTQDAFLAGYGAAQAVPGPLFTFSAYLGAVNHDEPTGLTGAMIALVMMFLPSGLLLMGVLPFWDDLRRVPRVRHALGGVNAAVVGLLGAALYNPVFVEGVTSPGTFALAVVAYLALAKWRIPAWAVVIAAAAIGALLF